MVRHGSSWFTVMVHHGSSWFTVMVSSWFVMVRDVLFSKILQKRSCDPLFSQSGSQIHYQISFLMRLLIFPFPLKSIPLKSSAKNQINLDLIEIIQFCLKIYDLLTHPHLWVGVWVVGWMGGLICGSMAGVRSYQ